MVNVLMKKYFVRALALLVIINGSIAIFGWWIDHEALSRLIPGYAQMTFNTAFCFVLIGAALLLTTVQRAVAGLVVAFAGLVLLQDLIGADFGIDRLLYSYIDYVATTPYPGRMAPTTASCFVMSGLALIFIHLRGSLKMELLPQLLIVIVTIIGSVNVLLRLVFPASPLAIAHFASMSLFTSIGFMLTASGLWLTFALASEKERQTPFAPAMHLLGHLKVTHKFLLVSLVAAIPLGVGLSFLVADVNERRASAIKEKQALAYIDKAVRFFELVPQHRGMSSAFLSGESGFRERAVAKQLEIERLVQAIDRQDREIGELLHTTDNWVSLKQQWLAIRQQAFSATPDESWNTHTNLIHDTMVFMQKIMSVSGLAAETSQGNRHMVEAYFNHFPLAIEMAGQLRGMGAGAAASRTVDDVLLFTLRERAKRLQDNLINADFHFKLAYLENEALRAIVEPKMQENIELADKYVALLEKELLEADDITISPELYFDQGTRVVDVSIELFLTIGDIIESAMQDRIDRIAVNEYFLMLFTFLGLAIFIYIFSALYLFVMRSVSFLDEAAIRLIRGDMDAGVGLGEADELEHAAGALQRIAAAMATTSSRMKSVVEHASDGIITANEIGGIESINPAAVKIFGYSRDEITGQNLGVLIADDHREHFATGLNDLLATGESDLIGKERMELSGKRKDGTQFPMELSVNRLRSGGHRICLVELRDISERKKAEEMLRKLSQAVEQAGESIVITDKDGDIEYVNPAFTRITGYSFEEVRAQNPRILKSGKQNETVYQNLWSTITNGQVWQKMVIDRKKDGSLYPTLLSIAPIWDEDHQISHYVGIQQDMTEHELLEEKFRQAQKMESIGTLVGGIAHDFNNMLAGMTGNLYLARNKAAHLPEVVERLENVERLSFQAASMIQQLLTFARKSHIEMKPFGLTSFVRETSRLHKAGIPENISFHSDFCKEELVVKGDATQLQQVLLNLLNNAHDAVEGRPNPTITLRLEESRVDEAFRQAHPNLMGEVFAHLSVEDNGCGISSEAMPHIMEPFFTTKDVGKGTGLGLAMAHGAIKLHGGTVQIESHENEGTTVHIYLPLKAEEVLIKPEEVSEEIVSGHGETILVVDDNIHIRENSREVLESLGYHVLEAVDGLNAVEVFSANRKKIALILMDVVMPKLGGVAAAGRIVELKPGAKVVFSTGYDKDESLRDEMPGSDATVLSKPFSVEKLSQTIRQQLDS